MLRMAQNQPDHEPHQNGGDNYNTLAKYSTRKA
jgi:hypothetical protein